MADPEALLASLDRMPEADARGRSATRRRIGEVLRPVGALDRLDDLAVWLAGWQRACPRVATPVALVFGADHGVVGEGVSAFPSAVTAVIRDALRTGIATASAMARALGVSLRVVDVGIGEPTGNLAREDALDRARFAGCIDEGRAAVADARSAGADLLVLGEIGIGNTTVAAAVCGALLGGPASQWVGPGAGATADILRRKGDVVRRACARIDAATPPLEVLRRLGGAELAAIAGAIVEARRRSIPVVLDGYVVAAAAAPLALARAGALAHCVAGHVSAEPGHRRVLDRLGMEPILDLSMALGEGTGGLLAVPVLRAAAAAATDVGTFADVGLVR